MICICEFSSFLPILAFVFVFLPHSYKYAVSANLLKLLIYIYFLERHLLKIHCAIDYFLFL